MLFDCSSEKDVEMHNRQQSEKKLLVESLSEQLKQQCCDLKQLKVDLTKVCIRCFQLSGIVEFGSYLIYESISDFTQGLSYLG